MISYEDAFKKAKELKPSIDNCTECDNAFIFGCSADENFEGGGHTPCVIVKESGDAISMPLYVAKYGFGEEIRTFNI